MAKYTITPEIIDLLCSVASDLQGPEKRVLATRARAELLARHGVDLRLDQVSTLLKARNFQVRSGGNSKNWAQASAA